MLFTINPELTADVWVSIDEEGEVERFEREDPLSLQEVFGYVDGMLIKDVFMYDGKMVVEFTQTEGFGVWVSDELNLPVDIFEEYGVFVRSDYLFLGTIKVGIYKRFYDWEFILNCVRLNDKRVQWSVELGGEVC